MTGSSFDRTRKIRKILSLSAYGLLICVLVCGYLFFKKIIPGIGGLSFMFIGLSAVAVLFYITHAVWKCPSCKKQMGNKKSITFCPSCGFQLFSDHEHRSLDDRIREFIAKSERATSKEKLVEALSSKRTKRRWAIGIFFGLCGLLAVLGIFTDIPGMYLFVIWIASMIGYLVYDFVTGWCPLCKGFVERDQRCCPYCGLASNSE